MFLSTRIELNILTKKKNENCFVILIDNKDERDRSKTRARPLILVNTKFVVCFRFKKKIEDKHIKLQKIMIKVNKVATK